VKSLIRDAEENCSALVSGHIPAMTWMDLGTRKTLVVKAGSQANYEPGISPIESSNIPPSMVCLEQEREGSVISMIELTCRNERSERWHMKLLVETGDLRDGT
jgi:hypothetical protein